VRRRALGAGAALVAVLLSISAHQVAHYPIDLEITRAVQGVHGAWFHVPLSGLSALGFAPLVAVFDGTLILVILVVWGRWAGFASGFAALGAPGLQHVVKALVARPRPPATLVHVAHQIGNPAFPAGHVLDITSFLGFVGYLASVRLRPSVRRTAVIALSLGMVALMGLARIDAGEHWASDVLGGYLFGFVWLVATIEFYAWGMRREHLHRTEDSMRGITGAVVFLLLSLTPAAAGLGADPLPFKIAHRILLGGEGGWDALTMDAPTHRLFVTHSTRVQVVDVLADSVIGEVPDTPGVHGVALAPDLGRGFTSNGRDSTVTLFDLKTLAVLGRIKLAAKNPDAIEYDPASKRVFAFNGGSASATAIDAAAGSIVGNVPLDGKPEFAVADGKGTMFVNLEDSSAVLAFDTRTLRVLHRWPLAPGEEPSGLAMDRKHRRLFAGCSNRKLVVLDADNGRVVSVLPIGERVDGVAFDASLQLVFSSNGDGTLTVIHEDGPDRFTVIENAATQTGARTLALDESRGCVYLPTAQFGQPPPPTADRPHPRGTVVPGTFVVLEARR